jgi:ribosome recycling factor
MVCYNLLPVMALMALSVGLRSLQVLAFAPPCPSKVVVVKLWNGGLSSLLSSFRKRQSIVLFMAEETTTVKDTTRDVMDRMAKSVESVIQNMNTIRTGRASPAMLDRVRAEYYGVETPINQMATITTPSSQQLTIDPFDKSTLAAIERAIMEADLGLTPQNDGSVIRLNVPDLTQDRRKDMMKQCKAIGEEGKVAIRNIRRSGVDAIKKLEKAGEISEDEAKDGQDEIQKMTDAKVKEIDNIVTKKEKEVMTV